MNKIIVPARAENVRKVLDFITEKLKQLKYSKRALLQLELSVEEAFVNIVNYAYENHDGEVLISCSIDETSLQVTIQFIDTGIQYNPLEKEDPDISLNIQEKEVGGLGILLIKNNVDSIRYEYKNGKNILTLQKKLNE
ncbi:ATP-binding protein [Methanobacterium sp. ACI-7]|uniref:ATP-binding protein n=1 Tax=unclassified Methanobacterium TaxID=2627676 RepID=UPI0039C10BB5